MESKILSERSQGGLQAGKAVRPLFSMDAIFFRAQALLKTRKAVGVKRQKVVAAIFYQPGTGDSQFYDLPAYLRKRINQYDLDNHCRAAAYADRVRTMIDKEAA